MGHSKKNPELLLRVFDCHLNNLITSTIVFTTILANWIIGSQSTVLGFFLLCIGHFTSFVRKQHEGNPIHGKIIIRKFDYNCQIFMLNKLNSYLVQ